MTRQPRTTARRQSGRRNSRASAKPGVSAWTLIKWPLSTVVGAIVGQLIIRHHIDMSAIAAPGAVLLTLVAAVVNEFRPAPRAYQPPPRVNAPPDAAPRGTPRRARPGCAHRLRDRTTRPPAFRPVADRM
jgi:hypothetical protein